MKYLMIIVFCMLALPSYSYDKYDILVCEAEADKVKQEQCFTKMGIPTDPEERLKNINRADYQQKKEPRFSRDQLMMGRNMELYADKVIIMLERLAETHPRCKERLDPYTAGVSSMHGTSSNPSFFVQCGSRTTPEVVRFSLKDISNEQIPEALRSISRKAAIKICHEEAKKSAAMPSTVNFSVMDINFRQIDNGNATLASSFKAKNMLGVKSKYRIFCTFEGIRLTGSSVKPF